MDANRQRSWLLAERQHWALEDGLAYDDARRTLRLRSQRLDGITEDRAIAEARLAIVPTALDRYGNHARWSERFGEIRVGGAVDGVDVAIPDFVLPETPTDLCVGTEGVLHVALPSGVYLHDLRGRWTDRLVTAPGFTPWRLAVQPGGGVFVLDRDNRQIARTDGAPFPHRPGLADDGSAAFNYNPDVFRPKPENPDQVRLEVFATLPGTNTLVAIAASPSGRLAALEWRGPDEEALFWLIDEAVHGPVALTQITSPYSVRWIDDERFAVITDARREARAFRVPAEFNDALTPLGQRFPLVRPPAGHGFAHVPHGPPLYPKAVELGVGPKQSMEIPFEDPVGLELNFDTRAPGHVAHVRVRLRLTHPDTSLLRVSLLTPDSHEVVLAEGVPGVDLDQTWDLTDPLLEGRPLRGRWRVLIVESAPAPPGERVVIEAHVEIGLTDRHKALFQQPFVALAPTGSALGRGTVFAATDEEALRQPIDAVDPNTQWHRAYLEAAIPRGCRVELLLAATDLPVPPEDDDAWHPHTFGGAAIPRHPHGVWVDKPSEVPFAESMLPCPLIRDEAGLFTALIQRVGHQTATLIGRYLHVRVRLFGTGRRSPEIAAVRVYGGRFSYVQNYLPELYREDRYGPDADAVSPTTTPADFLERFLGNFEGILTPIEDRIGDAHLLTTPERVPVESMEWLASWMGLVLDTRLPEDRQRALLKHTHELHRWRGTRRGLELALDLTTGGAITRGQIVVVEQWRLRRTFATLLGVHLVQEDDPLLPGLHHSGNSVVGDTLILGDEWRREFLALFAADFDANWWESWVIERFFDRFAHRVTVLVQKEAGPDVFAIAKRVAEREAPTHLELTVAQASHPLVVGLWSLVGVDTYLGHKPTLGPVRVDRSTIGERHVLRTPATLDHRLEEG